MMRSHWKYLDFDDLVGLVVSVLMVVIVGETVKDEAFEKNKINPLKKKAQLEDGFLWKLLRPQHMQVLESAPVIADVVTFLEAKLELLEQATLPTEEEGLTLTGRVGNRTAQLILEKIATPDVMQIEDLDATERGVGGFGSTGV
ncbi:hypothetical protein POTOM_060363 [Populus tomentosa]|uniref:dUTP diphosphatase n=1 Tax=Populus tomentosa TaxID=118781 RepID=A0A8X7XTZ1_POPTO|nr:hypothetical protein POTOM_060363 [Populus tomentosa]